jgi:phage anti-repressor protein
MSSTPDLKQMFQEWNELNIKAQESMGKFDFANIKKIRKGQKKIEDTIYEILKENAPANIKKIIPEDCGEMEVGFDTEGNVFYFVMMDPETEDEEEIKLIAITIDIDKKISMIEDFEIE